MKINHRAPVNPEHHSRSGPERLQIVFVAVNVLLASGLLLRPALAQTEVSPTTESQRSSSLQDFRTYPLLDQANRALAADDPEQARRFLNRAIQINDTDPALWIALGNVELQAGSPSTAITYFDNALTLDDTSARGYLYRGLGRLASGDKEAGLLDIGQSLQSNSLSMKDETLAKLTVSKLGYAPDFLLKRISPDQFAALREEVQTAPAGRGYKLLSDISDLPADLRLMRATLALRIGKENAALADIENLLAEESSAEQHVAAQRLAIDVRGSLGDEVGVVDAYRALLAQDALSSTELYQAAASARRIDDVDAAGLFLNARLRFETGAVRRTILMALVELDVAGGKPEQAESRLRELAYDRTAPNTERAQAWRSMGQLSDRMGDELKAWIAYKRAFALSGVESDATLIKSKETSGPVVEYQANQIIAETSSSSVELPTDSEVKRPVAGRRSTVVVSERMRARLEAENCQGVLVDLKNSSNLENEPSLLFNIADCMQRVDYNIAADRIFRRALDHAAALSAEQRLYAWSSIAFLSEARSDYSDAHAAWIEVADIDDDVSARLNAARTGRLAGQWETARVQLQRIDPDALEDDADRIAYFDELSLLLEPSQPTAAIAAIERSLAIPDSAYRHRRAAAIAMRIPDHKLAIKHLNNAVMLDPNDIDTRLQLGYKYIELGNIREATDTFETLAQLRPDDTDILLQYAHLQKQQNEYDKAAEAYRNYIDVRTSQTEPSVREALSRELLDVRSEIRSLERNTYVYGVVASEDASGSSAGSAVRTSASDSPAELEAGWNPRGFERRSGTRLTAFTRLSGTMNDRWGEIDDDSAQVALGLRWQPMPAIGLYLQGQRRIGLDEAAPDSWVLTSAYSWSSAYAATPADKSWNLTTLYSDVSLTFGDIDARSGFAEAQQGRVFSIMRSSTVTPHFVVTGRGYDDEFGFKAYIDGGVGVSARTSFGADTYRSSDGYVDLALQYRRSLVNDYSDENEKFSVRMTVGF